MLVNSAVSGNVRVRFKALGCKSRILHIQKRILRTTPMRTEVISYTWYMTLWAKKVKNKNNIYNNSIIQRI